MPKRKYSVSQSDEKPEEPWNFLQRQNVLQGDSPFSKIAKTQEVSNDIITKKISLTLDSTVDVFNEILNTREKICSVEFVNEENNKRRFIYNLRNFSSKRWKNALLYSLKNDLEISLTNSKKGKPSKIISTITKDLACIVNPTLISFAPLVNVIDFIKRIKSVRKYRKQHPNESPISDHGLIFRGQEQEYGIRLFMPKTELVEYLPPTAETIILEHYIYIIRALQRAFSCVSYEDAVLKTPQKFNSTINKIRGGKYNIFRSMCITTRIPKSCRLLLSSCDLSFRYCYIPQLLYNLFFPQYDPNDLENAPTVLVVRFPTITTSQLALQAIPWNRQTFGLPYSLFSLIAGDCDGDAISIFAVDSEDAIEVNMLLNPWFKPYNGLLKPTPSHDFILSHYLLTNENKSTLLNKLNHLNMKNMCLFKPSWLFSEDFRTTENLALRLTNSLSLNIYSLLKISQTMPLSVGIEQALLESEASSLNFAMIDQIMIKQGFIPSIGTAEIIENDISTSIIQGPKYGNELIGCIQSARGSVVYGKVEIRNSGANLNKLHFNLQHLCVSNLLTVTDGNGAFVHDEPGLWFPKIKQIPKDLRESFLDFAAARIWQEKTMELEEKIENPMRRVLWHRPSVYEIINLMNLTKHTLLTDASIDSLIKELFKKDNLLKRFSTQRFTPVHKLFEEIPFSKLWINFP